jgi:cell division septation protein DedD
MPNGDPRPIKTLSVSGGSPGDGGATAATPAPKPAKVITAQPVLPRNSPVNANASANNAPMAITPQQAPAGRVAALSPSADQPAAASGGWLVSISSQNSEAEATSSYQAVQAKYSSVLGSYSPVIKRVEPNGKGVMYRAAVGPFSTREEANKMCGSLKAAGGQCFPFSN